MDLNLDLPHIGALCKRVRECRGISPQQIANECGVAETTITRNLEQYGSMIPKTFHCYVEALRSRELTARPILQRQANILLDLYRDRKKLLDRQQSLAEVNLETIKSRRRPQELTELVEELRGEDRPAFIMDDLWFIHATNGAAWRLFGIDPENSRYLKRWEAWHTVGTKFCQDSPVRHAHHNPDEFFPPTIVYFFEDKRTYPYLFTFQMRALLRRLIDLSDRNRFEFTIWWDQATCFNLQYKLRAMTRTIWYQQHTQAPRQRIQTEAMTRIEQEVGLQSGAKVGYTLAVWAPMGSDATTAFEEIRTAPRSHELYYAADYDTQHNFHVNNWPEVGPEMVKWT